jgi:hypothetical protein
MKLHVAGSALTMVVTVNRTVRGARIEFDGHDWGTICYLTKVIGGSAQAERDPDGALCLVVSVPLAVLMTRDADHRGARPHPSLIT